MEYWKQIDGYNGVYEVSSLGRYRLSERPSRQKRGGTRNIIPAKILKPHKHRDGYINAKLSIDSVQKTYLMHRIVAEHFIPNPNSLPQINHKDGDKTNNCIDNLEWCTASTNIQHAVQNGLRADINGSKNPMAKLTNQQVVEIYTMNIKYGEAKYIAATYGISPAVFSQIRSGERWAELTKNL